MRITQIDDENTAPSYRKFAHRHGSSIVDTGCGARIPVISWREKAGWAWVGSWWRIGMPSVSPLAVAKVAFGFGVAVGIAVAIRTRNRSSAFPPRATDGPKWADSTVAATFLPAAHSMVNSPVRPPRRGSPTQYNGAQHANVLCAITI
jgi:hypothetical protein